MPAAMPQSTIFKEEEYMAKNRYVGSYPVIGIRPIIDGRRGPMKLRESLEGQVMAMAEAAKKLFEDNLYYSNALLVLRLRDHGYGSHDDKGRMGL